MHIFLYFRVNLPKNISALQLNVTDNLKNKKSKGEEENLWHVEPLENRWHAGQYGNLLGVA